ncbi:MAG: hypothetical protein QXG39_06615 [Candidatus Aenigmatarchaeota archaeon]
MSQSLSRLIFETQRLLSAKIGAQYPFYKETACLDSEIREYLAYCEIIKIFFPNNKRLIEFIDTKLKPSLEKIGIARWARTEITDLGFKVGYEQQNISLKYLEKAREKENAGSDSN